MGWTVTGIISRAGTRVQVTFCAAITIILKMKKLLSSNFLGGLLLSQFDGKETPQARIFVPRCMRCESRRRRCPSRCPLSSGRPPAMQYRRRVASPWPAVVGPPVPAGLPRGSLPPSPRPSTSAVRGPVRSSIPHATREGGVVKHDWRDL